MNWLYPNNYVKTIHDIDYDDLHKKGIRGVMFDIDNTLAAFDAPYPTKEVIVLFDQLKVNGFEVCLVSNNSHKRVNKYNEKLLVPAFPRANKPLTANLRKAMASMGTTTKQTAFVGDQLFTDVWAGNTIGFTTILVKPIQDKEQLITKVKRGLESMILNSYLKKNGLKKY